jgi:hypothetical protein
VRKAQNRIAQREFRLRKQQYVGVLYSSRTVEVVKRTIMPAGAAEGSD